MMVLYVTSFKGSPSTPLFASIRAAHTIRGSSYSQHFISFPEFQMPFLG